MRIDPFTISFALALIILPTAWMVLVKYLAARRAGRVGSTPYLLSYFTKDTANITPFHEGKIGEMHYCVFATSEAQATIIRVELDFTTKAHLLSVPVGAAVNAEAVLAGSTMEPVDLEGDYNSVFALYSAPGQQETARYLLDPKAMAFTLDFCRSQCWEIIGAELYFIQMVGEQAEGDSTLMIEDVPRFVEEIKPVLARPLGLEQRQANAPYHVDRRDALPCPICTAAMPNKSSHFACPNGHGILISGRYLGQLDDGELDISGHNVAAIDDRGPIVCPACKHTMQKTPYNGSLAIIDSCTNCPYRWLDGVDIATIERI